MLFFWPLHGRKEGENKQKSPIGVLVSRSVCLVLFVAKGDAFFSTLQIFCFSWTAAWIRMTLLTHYSHFNPSRPGPERQLWPCSATTAFPQCSTDDHRLTLQPHVNFGGHTKVGPHQRSGREEGASWYNKKMDKSTHRNSKHTRLRAILMTCVRR